MNISRRSRLLAGMLLTITSVGLIACSRPTPAGGVGDEDTTAPSRPATESIPTLSPPEGYQPPSPEPDGPYPGADEDFVAPDPYPGVEPTATPG
jgi:hypothetical protein